MNSQHQKGMIMETGYLDSQSAFYPKPGRGTLEPASCFTRLDDSLSQLRTIRNRVSALADALAGCVPEACSGPGAGKEAGGGRFDQIDMSAAEIFGICAQIESSLTRIESRL